MADTIAQSPLLDRSSIALRLASQGRGSKNLFKN